MTRVLAFALLASSALAAGRADNLDFANGGELQTPAPVQHALNFPMVSTAYTWGDKFRALLQMEVARYQALHFDANVGEQFLGASAGLTLGNTGIGNISALVGGGYDLDDDAVDLFFGLSHRSSLLSLSSFKTFVGYDVLNSRLRKGLAAELYRRGDWRLDAVATTKFFGRRNFLGAMLGRDYFEGQAGALELDLGVFVGWDFNEPRKSGGEGALGAGLGFDLRF